MQEAEVGVVVVVAPMLDEVGVDLVLELVASGEECLVAGAHVGQDGFERGPEIGSGDAGAGRQRRLDEVVEGRGDLEGTNGDHAVDVNDRSPRWARSRYGSA